MERGQVTREAWLDRCYKSLVTSNPSCLQLLEEVSAALARHVTEPQESELRQQAVFLLLGPEYTAKHFPYHRYNVRTLEPPLNPQRKESYLKEARLFLDECFSRALEELSYPRDASRYTGDTPLGKFVGEVRAAYRECVNQRAAVTAFEQEDEKRRQLRERKKKSPEEEEEEEEESVHVTVNLSEAASEAIVSLVGTDAGARERLRKRLKEKYVALPPSLRLSLWWEVLGEREEGVRGEGEVRERLLSTLEREMKRQRLRRAIESKAWRAIDEAVIEAYDTTPLLAPLESDGHLLQTARALNIMTVLSGKFSSSFVFSLVPLQLLLRRQQEQEDEAVVMRVASWGYLLCRHCLLEPQEVFGVAEEVVRVVGMEDPAYLSHLRSCLSAHTQNFNVQVFPPELLTRNTEASLRFHAQLTGRGARSLPPVPKGVFSEPSLFVRKWIAQVFVGVVEMQAALWVWDQLFLDKWRRGTVKFVALSLLAIIRPWVMRASAYDIMKVLLEEPGRAYLGELRRAFAHLAGGGRLQDTPAGSYVGGEGVGGVPSIQQQGK
ncbi:uncharacterized protein LOC123520820 [Portunus trituberculatus]|uniref:uncharacterized protein LOC123520820 n=1 Tax=Portunus trituberculatus TaxID=210409 RepID=UPI001E1D1074|nr:uncharacterized protein LOC123520820 [Portunus trituberculatus]